MTGTALGATTDLLRLLGDPTRVRLLALLEREELTVAELTRITRLAQSRVSTHLGKLRDAGLVRDRKSGAASFHRMAGAGMPPEARALWEVVQQASGKMEKVGHARDSPPRRKARREQQ